MQTRSKKTHELATPRVRVRFRMAEYLFTYERDTGRSRVRIDMWRENAETLERHWITVAACAPTRASARSVALALVAWVKSCDVGTRRDVRSQAVAESFAMLREHLSANNPGATGRVTTRPRALPARAPETTRPDAFGGTRAVAA